MSSNVAQTCMFFVVFCGPLVCNYFFLWSSNVVLHRFKVSDYPLNIFNKQALEKTDGTIKNGESRDTDYIMHSRHRTKTDKTQKHIQLKR